MYVPPEWLPTSRHGPSAGMFSSPRTSPRKYVPIASRHTGNRRRMYSGSQASRSSPSSTLRGWVRSSTTISAHAAALSTALTPAFRSVPSISPAPPRREGQGNPRRSDVRHRDDGLADQRLAARLAQQDRGQERAGEQQQPADRQAVRVAGHERVRPVRTAGQRVALAGGEDRPDDRDPQRAAGLAERVVDPGGDARLRGRDGGQDDRAELRGQR